jgi:hypothetical protein
VFLDVSKSDEVRNWDEFWLFLEEATKQGSEESGSEEVGLFLVASRSEEARKRGKEEVGK